MQSVRLMNEPGDHASPSRSTEPRGIHSNGVEVYTKRYNAAGDVIGPHGPQFCKNVSPKEVYIHSGRLLTDMVETAKHNVKSSTDSVQ